MESYSRHHVGLRLPTSKGHRIRMSVARHELLSSWPAVDRKAVHDPIKNVLAHLWWGGTQWGLYCHLSFFLEIERWCHHNYHLIKGTKLWLFFVILFSIFIHLFSVKSSVNLDFIAVKLQKFEKFKVRHCWRLSTQIFWRQTLNSCSQKKKKVSMTRTVHTGTLETSVDNFCLGRSSQ